jgi:isoleucyl-tRNA synthetase
MACDSEHSTIVQLLCCAFQVMAPFTPFLTEHIYQNLRRCHGADSSDKSDSVHFCDVPAATQESQADTHIQQVTPDAANDARAAEV